VRPRGRGGSGEDGGEVRRGRRPDDGDRAGGLVARGVVDRLGVGLVIGAVAPASACAAPAGAATADPRRKPRNISAKIRTESVSVDSTGLSSGFGVSVGVSSPAPA
jgi:hypothetical protein